MHALKVYLAVFETVSDTIVNVHDTQYDIPKLRTSYALLLTYVFKDLGDVREVMLCSSQRLYSTIKRLRIKFLLKLIVTNLVIIALPTGVCTPHCEIAVHTVFQG